MTKPYRPSNGTEGMIFFEEWCFRCKKDDLFRCEDPDKSTTRCDILDKTMALDSDDPEYPKEWVYDPGKIDEGGHPQCTAFEEME